MVGLHQSILAQGICFWL